MSFAKQVWTTLASVNVNEHTEKKGNLTYLSWAYAWSTLKSHYADSTYSFREPVSFPDGSMEVWVDLTISDGENSVKGEMWLPVMDNRNNSVIKPTSRQISDARMRCLAKAVAVVGGCGWYIYAGEDLPDPAVAAEAERIRNEAEQAEYDALCKEHDDTIAAIISGIEADDYAKAAEAWFELDEETKRLLWKAPSKGGVFTTQERATMKTPEFRTAQ